MWKFKTPGIPDEQFERVESPQEAFKGVLKISKEK